MFTVALVTVAALATYAVGALIIWGPGSLRVDGDRARAAPLSQRPLPGDESERLLEANVTLASYCLARTGDDRRLPAERTTEALAAADRVVSIAIDHPDERFFNKRIRDVLVDDAAIVSDCFPEQASRLEQAADGLP